MDSTDKILQELLNWTKVGFYASVKGMLSDVLNTENKRLAYQLADGTRGRDAIKTAAGMGSDSVTELFRQCVNLGLMDVNLDNKRRGLFNLDNFGLAPQIEQVKSEIKSKAVSGGKI